MKIIIKKIKKKEKKREKWGENKHKFEEKKTIGN